MNTTNIYRVLLILFAVGIPGFLEFDRTNLTHEFGLINAQSIAKIILSIGVGAAFLMVFLYDRTLQRAPSETRTLAIFHGLRLPLLIFALFAATAILTLRGTDLLLALFRVYEWILAIFLVAMVVPARSRPPRPYEVWVPDFLKVVILAHVIIVIAGLLVVPNLAMFRDYGAIQLGGYLVNPGKLALLCGMGAILFWGLSRSPSGKVIAVLLFIVMLLTYSRAATISAVFAICFALVVFNFKKNPALSAFSLSALLAGTFFLIYHQAFLLGLLSRGASLDQILTLNSRTVVWETALRVISDHPWVGLGFIAGAKRLGDFVGASYWSAPHAHNDILNAMVSGGVLMGPLLLLVYLKLFVDLFRSDFPRRHKGVYLAILIPALVVSNVGGNFSSTVWALGIISLVLLRYFAVSAATRTRRVEQAAVLAVRSARLRGPAGQMMGPRRLR